MRDLGPLAIRRAHRLDVPFIGMLLNGVHDHHNARVFVLEVGAGTGESGLPLLSRFRDDGWSALLIEPLPQHFAQLEALHKDSDRVAILNLGISDVSASLALHSLTPEAQSRLRRGPRGRASLLRDRIVQPGLGPEDVQATEVPFLRMDTVLDELGIDGAQLIIVNAGGHEAQVLASFDLAALDPSLVMIHATPGTAAEDGCKTALAAAGLLPFHLAGWLVGLAPDRLAVPMDELLTFFHKGAATAPEDDE